MSERIKGKWKRTTTTHSLKRYENVQIRIIVFNSSHHFIDTNVGLVTIKYILKTNRNVCNITQISMKRLNQDHSTNSLPHKTCVNHDIS